MSPVEAGAFVIGLIALAAALEFALLRARSEGGDTGGFWARTAYSWSVVCVLVLGLTIARGFADFISNRIPERGHWWLAGIWLAILLSGIVWPPDPRASRWIAGGIGFGNQRYWVAGFAVALLVPLGYSFGASDAYDAVLWACTVIMAMTVLMISVTQYPPAGLPVSPKPAPRRTTTDVPVSDWPAAMAAAGIKLEGLPALGATLLGASPSIPAEMLSAVRRLVMAGPMDPESARLAMIQAPESCGQEEALAYALSALQERSEEVTLVITPGDPSALSERLRRRLGQKPAIGIVHPGSAAWAVNGVWMVEASVLSQHLLKQLREDSTVMNREELPLLSRVGLIVWWDVHEYSGVRAANLWAISRRLDRLLTVKGRGGLRVLLFAAPPSDAADRSGAFLSHLFPYEISAASQVIVRPHPARVVYPFVAKSPASMTAMASVRTGWPTLAFATEPAIAQSLQAGMDPKLAASLVPSLSQADATVVAVGANRIANLADLLATCGRHAHADLPHYVALVLPRNPYVDYLMKVYGERQRIPSRRLLVGAEGHPVLIERHTQLALTEYPDTMAGLRAIFRWDDEILTNTIRRLHAEFNLHRDAVRFLDEERRLRRDFLYSNRQPGRAEGSLDTVGARLVEAKETDSNNTVPAFRVDPERVVIDAYPRRVFFSGERRYRVEEAAGGFIRCKIEDEDVFTWRGRTSRFHRLTRETEPMVSRGIKRYCVTGMYREELTDVIEAVASGGLRQTALDTPRKTEFATRALILDTGRDADPDALQLIALAMRCMVPVHVGVDETHLEVLPVISERLLNGGFASGLAFIDLMPGGIGVTEAFHDDEALLRFLVDQAHDWLDSCTGRMSAQELFKDVPMAMATGGVAGLQLERAVSFLAAMAGNARKARA